MASPRGAAAPRHIDPGGGPPAVTEPDYDTVWRDVYGDMQERGPVHRHMRRLLRRTLGRLEYRTALDVGCGAGHNVELIRGGRDVAVTGVDISPVAVEAARERHPESRFEVLDIAKDPLPGVHDLVFSSLLLEHVADDAGALARMRDACAGHLVVSTIGGERDRYLPWEETVGHVRNYRRGELERALGQAGFDEIEVTRWGFPVWSPVMRRLQARSGLGAGQYGAGTAIVAEVAYWANWFNVPGRGDLLIGVARRRR